MADYYVTENSAGEYRKIMVTAALISGSDAEINAALPASTPVGAIIYTSGYTAMKQKGMDGSWTEL